MYQLLLSREIIAAIFYDLYLLIFNNYCILMTAPPPSQTTLLDTNPYLLGLTVAVSILHSVFDFLAFKNGKLFYL